MGWIMYGRAGTVAVAGTVIFILACAIVSAGADSSGNVSGIYQNQSCNQTLINEINNLRSLVEQLKVENLRLESENQKLRSELSQKSEWDAHILMDYLFIFTFTPYGKDYKLLFHEGGLGGVTVYQYVGPYLGDAGQWRQYKQIAFYKGQIVSEGFEKPGIVLKPVWGFNELPEVRINTTAELIAYENKYNSIYGLAEYYKWMFDKYIESAKYQGWKILFIIAVAVAFGMVLGESKRPIGRLLDYITIRRVTDFKLTKEEKKSRLRLRR